MFADGGSGVRHFSRVGPEAGRTWGTLCCAGGDAGERELPGLAGAGVRSEADGGFDLGSGGVGRDIEFDVVGKVVLVAQSVDFEGAEGFVGRDLGALGFPLGPGLEGGGGHLDSVEMDGGLSGAEAVVGQGVEDLLDGGQHGVGVVEDRG